MLSEIGALSDELHRKEVTSVSRVSSGRIDALLDIAPTAATTTRSIDVTHGKGSGQRVRATLRSSEREAEADFTQHSAET